MTRFLAPVTLAVLLALGPALASSEEAFRLQQEARALMRRALSADEPGGLYVDAAERLQRARGLLERELAGRAGDAELEERLASVNAMLFWCHKNTPATAGRERAPEPAPPVPAGFSPERQARKLFEEAQAFEREHGDDELLVLTRYFEVAERFVGTEWSIKAQRRSLELQRALLARRDEAGAGTPAASAAAEPLPARAERLLAEGKAAEALPEVEAALATTPDDLALVWARARLLLATGDPRGATRDLDRLIGARAAGPGLPTPVELAHRRGLAHLAARRWDEATADLRSCLAAPDAPPALKAEVELVLGKPHGEVRGGPHGWEFADAVPLGRRVKEVRLRVARDPRWGPIMGGVQVLWDGVKGQAHGGGNEAGHAIKLKKDEYVVAISGKHGDVIDSIVIHTNKDRYGPFGGKGGTHEFRIDAPPGTEICGFRGKAGRYFDSVGVIVRAVTPPGP